MRRFLDFLAESKLEEDAPVNAVGTGAIAGCGVGPQGEPGVNLKKKRKLDDITVTEDLDEADREAAAKAVHDAWMEHQKAQGHTSHKSPDGKEEYMKPYEKLSKPAKDLDRMAVDAVAETLGLDEETEADPETFAGAKVFNVNMDQWMKSRFGKNRYHRYANYVGTDEVGEEIRSYGRNTDKDIVLKDSTTAVMTYLRRRKP